MVRQLLAVLLCCIASQAASAQMLGPNFGKAAPQQIQAPMLVSSRLVALGQYARTNSNGTDTGSNSRIATWNESRATVTRLQVIFPEWELSAANEQTCPNPITITASFEYPAGTFNQITWGGAASATFQFGNLPSDIITLSTPWPSDAQAWVRSYITVPSGSVWCRGYAQQTSIGEAVDSGTSTLDLTLGGTITNNASVTGYGPIAVVGTAWTTAPVRFALAVLGDSETQGPGAVLDDRGNAGPWGRAAGYDNLVSVGRKVPFLNLAEQGTKVDQNRWATGALNNRQDLIAKAGITHVAVNWGTNDLNTDTAATIETNLAAVGAGFSGMGVKAVSQSIPPHSSSTDGWITLVNQTAFTPGYTGSPPAYGVLNNWIRTVPAPFYDTVDSASVVDSSQNSGLWAVGGGTLTTALTTDGVHWSTTNLNPEYGGTFLVRDVIIPKISTWCGCQ
jgi:hypothetical protein